MRKNVSSPFEWRFVVACFAELSGSRTTARAKGDCDGRKESREEEDREEEGREEEGLQEEEEIAERPPVASEVSCTQVE